MRGCISKPWKPGNPGEGIALECGQERWDLWCGGWDSLTGGLHAFNVCRPQTINYGRTRAVCFVLCCLLNTQWSACHVVETIKCVLNESLLYSLSSFDVYHIWLAVLKNKTRTISQLRIVKFKLLFKVHMDMLPRSPFMVLTADNNDSNVTSGC